MPTGLANLEPFTWAFRVAWACRGSLTEIGGTVGTLAPHRGVELTSPRDVVVPRAHPVAREHPCAKACLGQPSPCLL